jgi:hypothetical protein
MTVSRFFVMSLVMSGWILAACSSSPPRTPNGPTPSPTPDPSGPPASAGHSLVYAAHLGMVVLTNAGLGGMTSPSQSAPTRVWGWTGQEWQVLDSSGPPVRNLAGVTYDTRRQTLVMHGGTYMLGRSYGETWEWSGGWRQTGGNGPGVRDHTQLAFDADRGRAVLFGGSGDDPNAAFADTWEYDGSTWTRVATDGPGARVHHTMHYDPVSRRVVLAGGNTPGGQTLGDVWTWDGSRWSPAGSIGAPRSHARMTFDRGLNGLVLAGGLPAAGLGVLVGRGLAWSPLVTPSEPGGRYLTDIAYDERRRVLVLFGGDSPGGVQSDTWEFDGSTWRRVR